MENTPVFADETLAAAFLQLAQASGQRDRRLHAFICEAIENLQQNAAHGVEVPAAEIPSFYVHQYDVKRLWRLDVEPDWRIFYTWRDDQLVIIDLTVDGKSTARNGHTERSAPSSSSRNTLPRSVKE